MSAKKGIQMHITLSQKEHKFLCAYSDYFNLPKSYLLIRAFRDQKGIASSEMYNDEEFESLMEDITHSHRWRKSI